MKIAIIGAGNVGSTAALRITNEGLGDIVLVDKVPGLAKGKALDMLDARGISKAKFNINGTDKIQEIKGADIVVVTAGLARKPGMTREELLAKNTVTLKDISLSIKELTPNAIAVIVTNPLDLMTYLALKITGFAKTRVFGMGVSLDAARFSNIISEELGVSNAEVNAIVIGSHGEAMLPLIRFSKVNGKALDQIVDAKKAQFLIDKTINRGAEIVSCLGTGSAFYAPTQAIAEIVRAIIKDEKKNIGVCAFLDGEYGFKNVCIGLPCVIGKNGIEKIVKLDLNDPEIKSLNSSITSLQKNIESLNQFLA